MDPLALVVVVTSWIEFIFRDVSLGFTGFRALRCLISRSESFWCLMSRSEFVLVPHVPKRVPSATSHPVQFCVVYPIPQRELLGCIMSHTEFLLVPHILGSFASISHCWTCIIVCAH